MPCDFRLAASQNAALNARGLQRLSANRWVRLREARHRAREIADFDLTLLSEL